MPKNLSVVDIRPINDLAEDVLPKNAGVKDVFPNMNLVDGSTESRSYSVALGAGQPIGLLLAITYPTSGTVTQYSESGYDH